MIVSDNINILYSKCICKHKKTLLSDHFCVCKQRYRMVIKDIIAVMPEIYIFVNFLLCYYGFA